MIIAISLLPFTLMRLKTHRQSHATRRNSTSQARYYLRSQTEVMRLLGMMSDVADSATAAPASGRTAKPVSRFVSSPAVFQQ